MAASNEIVQQIYKELCVSYAAAGKFAPDALPAVAEMFADAIPFSDVDEVSYVFKKARDIESIPTQATLKQCWRNYSEEFLKYRHKPEGALKIGMENPLEQWIPKETLKRRINRNLAVVNYCVAKDSLFKDGISLYKRFCELHRHREEGDKDNKRWVLERPDEALAFDTKMFDEMRPLYVNQMRKLPRFAGFPEDARFSFSMNPPLVGEFVQMIKLEKGI